MPILTCMQHDYELQIKSKELLALFRAKLCFILSLSQIQKLEAIEINLNTRMRSALGRAFLLENRIDLNERLLKKHPEELAATVAHELAHLAAPLIYGRKGLHHREGWRRVMKYLDFPADRTHSLNTDEFKARQCAKAWAACGCPDRRHPIYAQKLRKIKKRYCYICLKCKQEIHIITNTD
jgi:SprT protein